MADRHCAFGCGIPLDLKHTSTLRWEVTGWESGSHTRASGKKGGSDITLRQRTGAIAHKTCVEKAKRGIHPNQQSFDDLG